MILYKHTKHIIAGTTLRDENRKENNNMALHCGGDLAAVIENRTAFAGSLDIDVSQCVFAQQTHSANIHKVTKEDIGKGVFTYESGIPDCDALYTSESNILIGVFHADCVPIILYDDITNIICAIHSGWVGTMKQITSKTLEILCQKEGCHIEHMQAFIGPAIGFDSFEVGMEVVEQVKALPFPTEQYIRYKDSGKALVDNQGLNYQMLRNAGLRDDQIFDDKNDTFNNNTSLFSYRRDKSCGRHLSYIVRKENSF